jgi:hypothetical protein
MRGERGNLSALIVVRSIVTKAPRSLSVSARFMARGGDHQRTVILITRSPGGAPSQFIAIGLGGTL